MSVCIRIWNVPKMHSTELAFVYASLKSALRDDSIFNIEGSSSIEVACLNKAYPGPGHNEMLIVEVTGLTSQFNWTSKTLARLVQLTRVLLLPYMTGRMEVRARSNMYLPLEEIIPKDYAQAIRDVVVVRLALLSNAERDALQYLINGLSRERIAKARGSEFETVRSQFRAILKKLGVKTSTQAVMLAVAYGGMEPQATPVFEEYLRKGFR